MFIYHLKIYYLKYGYWHRKEQIEVGVKEMETFGLLQNTNILRKYFT